MDNNPESSSLVGLNTENPSNQGGGIFNNKTAKRNYNTRYEKSGIRMKAIKKFRIQHLHLDAQLVDIAECIEKERENGHSEEIAENENDKEIGPKESAQDFSLIISNLPDSWNYDQIKNYIQTECGAVDSLELIDMEGSRHVKVKFKSQEQFERSKVILNDKHVEEIKPNVTDESDKEIEGTDKPQETHDIMVVKHNSIESPELDNWEYDLDGLYGLKPDFLTNLNIKPPINNWVHVSNFRCDKLELRDAMEIAGRVLFCSMTPIDNRCAEVMYSHPLEAVQAVSMLNGQLFYGMRLNVAMENKEKFYMPKGIKKLGPGLGKNGLPIRNMARHYERYVKNQSSLINPNLFTAIDKSDITTENAEKDSQSANGEGEKAENTDVQINDCGIPLNEGKQLRNNTPTQPATQATTESSPSQNLVSNHPKTFHGPLLPLKVNVATPTARGFNTPFFRPPRPRPINLMQARLANLSPVNTHNVMFQNSYLNPLLRPKPRTVFAPCFLHQFKSQIPQNSAIENINVHQNVAFSNPVGSHSFRPPGTFYPRPGPLGSVHVGHGIIGPAPSVRSSIGFLSSGPSSFVEPSTHESGPIRPCNLDSGISGHTPVGFRHTMLSSLESGPQGPSLLGSGSSEPSPLESRAIVSGQILPDCTGFELAAPSTLRSRSSAPSPLVSRPIASGQILPDSSAIGLGGPTPLGSGSQELNSGVSEIPGPRFVGSGPKSFSSGLRKRGMRRSEFPGPRPTYFGPPPNPRQFVPPVSQAGTPEAKENVEEPEEIPNINHNELEDSTSHILINLPPNTTLKMLCDSLPEYERALSVQSQDNGLPDM